MRKILCRLGLHSRFVQHDKWGAALVCRFCEWSEPESCERHTHSLFYKCVRGNSLEEYLRKADAGKGKNE